MGASLFIGIAKLTQVMMKQFVLLPGTKKILYTRVKNCPFRSFGKLN